MTGYTGSGEGQYTFPAPPSADKYASGNYTPPTGGVAFTPLWAKCDVSGSTGTISFKKSDQTAPTGLSYTYIVKKFVELTGLVAGATGSGTSNSFTVDLATAATSYMVEITTTAPSAQFAMASCYRP